MVDHLKCTKMIMDILSKIGIYDVIKQDSSLYVGGSLPSFIVSQQLSNKNDEIVCNDIDLYTTNYVKTLHHLSKYFGNKITSIKRTGVNITFILKNTTMPIQIITSEFKSFYDDILGNYDCTLVSVGFYPYKNEFMTHKKFTDDLVNKQFICYYEKTSPKRIIKLTERAKKWFDAQIKIEKQLVEDVFRPYYKRSQMINSLQDIVSPPNYIQLYYNKYNCIRCDDQQIYLMCKKCVDIVEHKIIKSCNNDKNKRITILGGANGFGNVIKNVTNEVMNKSNVYVTTRHPSKRKKEMKYVLGEPMSEELTDQMLNSDIIVLNAYSTLEGDEKIWTTTIDNFDEKLALEKFTVNTIGYAKFLKQFVQERKKQISKHNLTNNIIMIFMDANESKFKGKLSDGKHLELNMAKTATKQVFYTNANLLASLGIITICYDPGWLSYHGISVDKIESKSKYLIPPRTSALCMIDIINNVDVDNCIDNKNVIFDRSVYDVVNTYK